MTDHEGRLSTVEAFQKSLHDDFQSLKKDVSTGFDRVFDQLNRMAMNAADRGKTNWGVILSGVFGIIGIMTLAFSPIVYGMQRHQFVLDRHEQILDERGVLFGQITTDIPRLYKKLDDFDVAIQREMRDLDGKTLTELHGMKNNLEDEIKLRYGFLRKRIEALDDKVNKLIQREMKK